MGTSATIVFKDEFKDIYLVNRGSDGFSDVILPDLKELVRLTKNNWSGSELNVMVSYFLCSFNDKKERLPYYNIIKSVRTDDSYQFYVFYNKDIDDWIIGYGDISYERKALNNLRKLEPIVCQECFEESTCIKENNYFCSSCNKELIVSFVEGYGFLINNEVKNIVFKEEMK